MKHSTLLLMPLAMLMASCNGLFGGIYDDPVPAEESRFGFVKEDDDHHGGTLYLDLRAYDRWTYVDFHQLLTDTANITLQQAPPHQWDIALHRYDAATNQGATAETELTSIDYATNIDALGTLSFQPDIDSQVVVDISQMMDGVLGYAQAQVNPTLSGWMNVDMSNMPPTYTPSGHLYVVRLADSTHAALLFTGYTNEAGTKGYVTIRYRYPL